MSTFPFSLNFILLHASVIILSNLFLPLYYNGIVVLLKSKLFHTNAKSIMLRRFRYSKIATIFVSLIKNFLVNYIQGVLSQSIKLLSNFCCIILALLLFEGHHQIYVYDLSAKNGREKVRNWPLGLEFVEMPLVSLNIYYIYIYIGIFSHIRSI